MNIISVIKIKRQWIIDFNEIVFMTDVVSFIGLLSTASGNIYHWWVVTFCSFSFCFFFFLTLFEHKSVCIQHTKCQKWINLRWTTNDEHNNCGVRQSVWCLRLNSQSFSNFMTGFDLHTSRYKLVLLRQLRFISCLWSIQESHHKHWNGWMLSSFKTSRSFKTIFSSQW